MSNPRFYESDYIREFNDTHADRDAISDDEREELDIELHQLRSEPDPEPQWFDGDDNEPPF